MEFDIFGIKIGSEKTKEAKIKTIEYEITKEELLRKFGFSTKENCRIFYNEHQKKLFIIIKKGRKENEE